MDPVVRIENFLSRLCVGKQASPTGTPHEGFLSAYAAVNSYRNQAISAFFRLVRR